MTRSEHIVSQAMALSPADRLEVIEQLWDSLITEPNGVELTEAQKQELDRRIAEMDAHPDASIPWQQVRSEFDQAQ